MALKKTIQRQKAGHAWTPTPLVKWEQALFSDTALGWRDKAAFMALHKAIKVDKVDFPNIRDLAAEAGMSITTFRQCANHLEYSGWIDMTARVRDKFSNGGSIVYTLWYRK